MAHKDKLTKKQRNESLTVGYSCTEEPARAHFMGPVDIMPYCKRCFIADQKESKEKVSVKDGFYLSVDAVLRGSYVSRNDSIRDSVGFQMRLSNNSSHVRRTKND